MKYLGILGLIIVILGLAYGTQAQVSVPNLWKLKMKKIQPVVQSWGLDFTNSTVTSTAICFSGDICRTTWPSGNNDWGRFGNTYGVSALMTSSTYPIWFDGAIYASSTLNGININTVYPSFTYTTSTSWTGTTTIPLGVSFKNETWNNVKCFTDAGTLNISFHDGTNKMNLFNASTTVGTIGLTTNNTFITSEKRYVDIGTPATSPTSISCAVEKIILP